MCPRVKALISSDKFLLRAKLPFPTFPRPDCNPEGNLQGDGQAQPQDAAIRGEGLHVSCKVLSPLSLGQALCRETPSSCWVVSFQLGPSITVYSFMKAALPLLFSLPLVQVCRYPIHEHLFPPSLEEFCTALTSSSALAEAGRRAQLALISPLAAVPCVGHQHQCNSSRETSSLACSSHCPGLCCWGKVHPSWSQPKGVNPLHSLHGHHWCWGCMGRSGPSPPLWLPLDLLPGLHHFMHLCTVHRTPETLLLLPRWVQTL